MKKITSILIALFFVTISCNNQAQKEALEFDRKMEKIYKELAVLSPQLNQAMKESFQTKNFSPLALVAKDLNAFTDKTLAELNALKTSPKVQGAEEVRNAMIRFFEFEKTFLKEAIEPFTKMNEKTSDAAIDAALYTMETKAEGEELLLQNIEKTLKNFSEKNKLINISE